MATSLDVEDQFELVELDELEAETTGLGGWFKPAAQSWLCCEECGMLDELLRMLAIAHLACSLLVLISFVIVLQVNRCLPRGPCEGDSMVLICSNSFCRFD